jgi:hypothetical protein
MIHAWWSRLATPASPPPQQSFDREHAGRK